MIFSSWKSAAAQTLWRFLHFFLHLSPQHSTAQHSIDITLVSLHHIHSRFLTNMTPFVVLQEDKSKPLMLFGLTMSLQQ